MSMTIIMLLAPNSQRDGCVIDIRNSVADRPPAFAAAAVTRVASF